MDITKMDIVLYRAEEVDFSAGQVACQPNHYKLK